MIVEECLKLVKREGFLKFSLESLKNSSVT